MPITEHIYMAIPSVKVATVLAEDGLLLETEHP